jgi:hypothetical protein
MRKIQAALFLALTTTAVNIPAIAAPTPVNSPATATSQPSLRGSWSTKASSGEDVLIIFDGNGKFRYVREKTHGDYRYHELPHGRDAILMSQISNNAIKEESWENYQVSGDKITFTTSDASPSIGTITFSDGGNSLALKFGSSNAETLNRVNDSVELPADTESAATVAGHFHGLKKLIAIQTAQTQHWQKKKRFANNLTSLSIPAMPESDQQYRFQVLKTDRQQSIIAAVAQQPNLRSYVFRLDRDRPVAGRSTFGGILCGTDRLNGQLPAASQLQQGLRTCPAQTHEIAISTRIMAKMGFF